MQWWYSQDEERWNGPCETREEAIAEGRCEYPDESFMICQAEQGNFDLQVDAYRIFAWLEEINEELTDPEGDPIFSDASSAQERELETMIDATIKSWADKNGLDYRAFMFTRQTGAENIPASIVETGN